MDFTRNTVPVVSQGEITVLIWQISVNCLERGKFGFALSARISPAKD
jgi:hypothetical protein